MEMIDKSDQMAWMRFLPYSIEDLQKRIDDISSRSWGCTSLKIEQHKWCGFWELEAAIFASGTHSREHTAAMLQFFVWHESGGQIYPLPGLRLPASMLATLSHLAYCTRQQPTYSIEDKILCSIYSDSFRQRIAENSQEFVWERIYPGTCFAPLGVFINHMERYRFAVDRFAHFHDGYIKDILDLGCGVGYGSKYLAAHLPEAIVRGVDSDAYTIADARQYYGGDRNFWIVDNTEHLDWFASDGITCFELLEHMANPHELLSTISELLNPGGVALISTPNGGSERRRLIRNPYHMKEFTYDEFTGMLGYHFDQVSIVGALGNDDVTQPNCYESHWFMEQEPRIENFIAVCQKE